ncbi:MAG: SRPBCC family protein [Gemmatimonadales bacterium]
MATASKVGVTTYATPTDREVVITRVVDAPRRVVFDAWTNRTHVPQWLLGPEGWTMPVCEIDLRPGGKWRYVWRKSDGREMTLHGSYREVVPPERLVWTESWGPEWPETVNTMVLTEVGGQTTITLTVRYPTKEARDAALKTGMKEGMDQGFARLDKLLRALV